MRVIAGQVGGRRLATPSGFQTRPATARVRSSIFSRLASRGAVNGARVLDIFAGSGALGVEALSRGAESVVFVDLSPAAGHAIRQNLGSLHLESRARVIVSSYRRALPQLAAGGERFEIVFIDPPYAEDSTAEVLALIGYLGLLAPHGFAVARQFHRAAVDGADGWECINCARIGDHRIALYRQLGSDIQD